MENTFETVLRKLATFGVVERDQVKNDLTALRSLVRRGYVQKVHKKGRVFYELTLKSLPWLDTLRKLLLQTAKLKMFFYPHRSHLYHALVEDVRFLDTTRKEVQKFQFLGDWHLNQKPVRAQLLLSQFRFYQKRRLT